MHLQTTETSPSLATRRPGLADALHWLLYTTGPTNGRGSAAAAAFAPALRFTTGPRASNEQEAIWSGADERGASEWPDIREGMKKKKQCEMHGNGGAPARRRLVAYC
jgi:hypothetical protein